MRKLLIAVFTIIMLSSSAWALFWLSGTVSYSGGGGVGAGKPVKVWFTSTTYQTIYTDINSMYRYSFEYETYFEKVSCKFTISENVYYGETNIQAYLYEDTSVDITVYLAPEK